MFAISIFLISAEVLGSYGPTACYVEFGILLASVVETIVHPF